MQVDPERANEEAEREEGLGCAAAILWCVVFWVVLVLVCWLLVVAW